MVTKEEISVIQIDLIIQIYDKLFTNVINKHWNILSKLLSEYDDASNDSLF